MHPACPSVCQTPDTSKEDSLPTLEIAIGPVSLSKIAMIIIVYEFHLETLPRESTVFNDPDFINSEIVFESVTEELLLSL